MDEEGIMTVAGDIGSRSGSAVTILMGTFNGARFLEEQLLSIERQSYQNWHLVVSDDGSTDRTPHILAEFKSKVGAHRVTIIPLVHVSTDYVFDGKADRPYAESDPV